MSDDFESRYILEMKTRTNVLDAGEVCYNVMHSICPNLVDSVLTKDCDQRTIITNIPIFLNRLYQMNYQQANYDCRLPTEGLMEWSTIVNGKEFIEKPYEVNVIEFCPSIVKFDEEGYISTMTLYNGRLQVSSYTESGPGYYGCAGYNNGIFCSLDNSVKGTWNRNNKKGNFRLRLLRDCKE